MRARLRDLEAEASGLVRRLRAAPAVELPGPHLVLSAGKNEVLLSAALVQEVVAVVALQPVPGAAAAVAGAFSCRGRSLFALELAALLEGRPAQPAHLDAHLVVLDTAQPLAVLVDRVKSVVTGVSLVSDETNAAPVQGALASVVARVGETLYPLLDAHHLAAWLESRA